MKRAPVLLLLLLPPLAGACSGRAGDDGLVFTIEQALATAPNGASLGSEVGGPWERLCIFAPGTAATVVDSVIGARTKVAERSAIATRDSHTLLIFASGSRVERYLMYPLEKGQFTAPEGRHCVERAAATFQIRHPIDGSIPWIGPVQP